MVHIGCLSRYRDDDRSWVVKDTDSELLSFLASLAGMANPMGGMFVPVLTSLGLAVLESYLLSMAE
jgi:hypothetical protein